MVRSDVEVGLAPGAHCTRCPWACSTAAPPARAAPGGRLADPSAISMIDTPARTASAARSGSRTRQKSSSAPAPRSAAEWLRPHQAPRRTPSAAGADRPTSVLIAARK